MFLRGKQMIGKSIRHPLATDHTGANPADVLRLIDGDKSVVPALLSAHMNLIISIAGKYAMISRADKHDLVSVGIVAAIEAMGFLRDEQIGPLIVSRVHSAMCQYVRKENRRHMSRLGVYDKEENWSPFGLLDIEDLLEKHVRSDFEKRIIELRRAGNNDREVAEIMGICDETVRVIRNEIARRISDNV
jgi:RNA polymerase sigma factor (sigma-70 family)